MWIKSAIIRKRTRYKSNKKVQSVQRNRKNRRKISSPSISITTKIILPNNTIYNNNNLNSNNNNCNNKITIKNSSSISRNPSKKEGKTPYTRNLNYNSSSKITVNNNNNSKIIIYNCLK